MFKAIFRSRAPKAQAASATAKVQPRIVQRYAETYVDPSGKERRNRTLARDEEGGFYNVKSNSKSGTEEFEYLNVGARTKLNYDHLSKSYSPGSSYSSGENLIVSEAGRQGYKIRPEIEDVTTNPSTGYQKRKVKLGPELMDMSYDSFDAAEAKPHVKPRPPQPGVAATGADQFTAAAVKSHVRPKPSSSSGAWGKANWANNAPQYPHPPSSQTAQASAVKPKAKPQATGGISYNPNVWAKANFGAPSVVNPGTDQPSSVIEPADPGTAVKKKGGRPKKDAGTTAKKKKS